MHHLLIAAALFVTACASTPANRPTGSVLNTAPKTTASSGSETDMVCKEQSRTGSNLPARKICRSQAEMAVDRKLVEDTLLAPNSRPHIFESGLGVDPRDRNNANR